MMREASMRAVRCHRFAVAAAATTSDGGSASATKSFPIRDVLRLDDVPAPALGENDDDRDHDRSVLISTHYAGVQYPDYLQARGLYQIKPPLPYVPGMDASGVVLAKGSGVPDSDLRVGDRVYANTALCPNGGGGVGALAEIVRVSCDAVFRVPDELDLSSVANLGRNYVAAYHSLKVIGNVGPDDLVLVDGASGGVGMAAVELAKARGAKVVAAVSSRAKGALPLVAGADRVLTYGRDRESYKRFKADFRSAAAELGHPDGASLIIDVVNGDLFQALVSCVKPLGTICLVGFAAGQRPIKPGLLLIKEASVVGSLWGRWARNNPSEFRENMNEILGFMVGGKIKPRADTVFSLEDYTKAFELFEDNEGRGNTVICLKPESRSKL